jgi:hypothetical protein
MSSLHALIMNLPISVPEMYAEPLLQTGVHAYKTGHRDARHAAAELAIAADKRIEELEEALRATLANLGDVQGLHAEIMSVLMYASRKGLILADKLNKGYPERSRTVCMLEELL